MSAHATEQRGCFASMSFWVQDRAAKIFSRYGEILHDHRLKFLIIPALIGLISFVGFINLETEFQGERLYTPQDSESFGHRDTVEATFGFDARFFEVYATGEPEGVNLITKAALLEYMTLFEDISAFSGEFKGEFKNLSTACFRPSEEAGCDLTSPLDFWNNSRATLEADPDVLATLNAVADSATDQLGRPLRTEDVLGGITRDNNGNIVSVVAFKFQLYLTNNKREVSDGENVDTATEAYELSLAGEVSSLDADLNLLVLYTRSQGEEDEEATKAIEQDVGFLPVGYILLVLYAAFVLFRRNHLNNYSSMALVSFAAIGIAIGACFAITVSLGVTYSTVVSVLAFLLFGLGMDDTFVLMAAFQEAGPSLPMRQRFARTLSVAGVSITITTVTDFVAFLSGSASSLPAIQDFCIYAAIGVVFDFALQITFFMAALVYAAYREKAGRADLLCCVHPAEPEKQICSSKPYDREAPGPLQVFFGEVLPRYILSTPGKVLVLLATVAITGVSAWAATQVEMDFNIEWFIPDNSYLHDTFRVRDDYFGSGSLPFNVYTFEADYPNEQRALRGLYTDMAASSSVVKCDTWYLNFADFVTANNATLIDGDGVIDAAQFYPLLADFLASDAGTRFNGRVLIDATTSLITATDAQCFFIDTDKMQTNIDNMDAVRAIAGDYPTLNGFTYAFAYLFFDGLAVVAWETVRNIIVAACVVLGIALVLLANIPAAFLIFLMLVITDINILGSLYYAGIDFNMVSAINLVIAVGLAIDSSVHVTHAFLVSHGNRQERAQSALRKMGASVFNGAFSTFLAVLPLAFAVSYIFQVFFVCLAVIVVFGIWCGYAVLPVLLSLIGPLPPPPTVHDEKGAHGAKLDSLTQMTDKPQTFPSGAETARV